MSLNLRRVKCVQNITFPQKDVFDYKIRYAYINRIYPVKFNYNLFLSNLFRLNLTVIYYFQNNSGLIRLQSIAPGTLPA